MKRGIIIMLAVTIAAAANLAAQETTSNPTTMSKKELRRTMRGYKAFYEAGYSFAFHNPTGNDLIMHPYSGVCDKLSFGTVQGFQVNNFFFMGAGIQMDYYTQKELKSVSVPVFLDLRVNFLNKRFSPFFDARIGSSFAGDVVGVYIGFQLGLRIGLPRNHAIFAAVEYTENEELCSFVVTPDSDASNIGFKIGYEF